MTQRAPVDVPSIFKAVVASSVGDEQVLVVSLEVGDSVVTSRIGMM